MPCEFCQASDLRFAGIYLGVVSDNNDPLGLGRVRVLIPVIAPYGTDWATPMGTLGGGIERRGFFAVPEEGAEVGVMFVGGMLTQPVYWAGGWGEPEEDVGRPAPMGAQEVPRPVKDAANEERYQIKCFETQHWLIWIDDRDGGKRLKLALKGAKAAADGSGDLPEEERAQTYIELDGENHTITLKCEDSIIIDGSAVSITGDTVSINERVVQTSTKGI